VVDIIFLAGSIALHYTLAFRLDVHGHKRRSSLNEPGVVLHAMASSMYVIRGNSWTG
jgi:hypothetical protein